MINSFKRKLPTWLSLAFIIVLLPSTVTSQTRSFTYQTREYVLDLPSPNWRAITVSGVAKDRTEFRYGDQGVIKMRIRRELVDAGVLPSDLLVRQQSSDRLFLRGFVKGMEENFQGRLTGLKYPYEYISAGKPRAGVIYYLQADNRTIYRLEFIGPAHELRSLGHQTDSIAQSFRLR